MNHFSGTFMFAYFYNFFCVTSFFASLAASDTASTISMTSTSDRSTTPDQYNISECDPLTMPLGMFFIVVKFRLCFCIDFIFAQITINRYNLQVFISKSKIN